MTEPNASIDAIPVLIVGAGPVGLGLALDLGWRGIPCLVVERTDGAIEFPRANAINVRTMEFCRRWGVADEVRAVGVPPDYPHTAIYVTSLAGHEIARIERPGHGGGARPSAFSPERPQRCNQLWFDPVLRRRAGMFPHVRFRYSCRYDSFDQDADGVVARVTDLASGREDRIRARYLVACCGGHSGIRNQLDIKLEGTPVLGTPVHIFFKSKALWDRHDKGKAALIYLMGERGRWATMVNVDGRDLWSLSVELANHDRKITDAEARAFIDRALGMKADYAIRSTSYWVRREMVASRYSEGRAFIAGDCAHLNGPEGGYGMNTGMGDAVDLGWKLAAVVQGWGGLRLLASYEAERRPIAQRNVREATKNVVNHQFETPAFLEDTPEGERQRREVGARITGDGARRHGHEGLALGYRYDPSPICWADEGPTPADDTSRYVPTAHPGCRAPHASLSDGRSILDLFGREFVLLRLGDAPADASSIVSAAADRKVPVAVHDIADPAVRELYGRNLVLVRPDGHVSWRADAAPRDPEAVIDRVRGT